MELFLEFENEKKRIGKIVEDSEKEKERRRQSQREQLVKFGEVYKRNIDKKVWI